MAGRRIGRKKKRAKTKTKTLRFTVQHPGGDLVSIQVSARLKRVPKGMKITKALLADMVRRKAETSGGYWDGRRVVGASEGKNPPGIELKIIRWKNPDRKNASDRNWRSGTQADAWGSLRNPLSAAASAIR